MPVGLKCNVSGYRPLRAWAEKVVRDVNGQPMVEAVKYALEPVLEDARDLVPVDLGGLRDSLEIIVEHAEGKTVGTVGSPSEYAPFVEEDTAPHWPPHWAIVGWAYRHGVEVFLVMRAISIRGTKGVHFLRQAVDKNKDEIQRRLYEGFIRIMQGGG